MLKQILRFFKRFIASFFILYGYNMIASPLGFIIPMNIVTVLSITILGIPALFLLIFLLVVIF